MSAMLKLLIVLSILAFMFDSKNKLFIITTFSLLFKLLCLATPVLLVYEWQIQTALNIFTNSKLHSFTIINMTFINTTPIELF